MKLGEYAIQLMNAIRNENGGKDITITLSHKDMAYRDTIGLAIFDAICGDARSESLQHMAERMAMGRTALSSTSKRLSDAEKEVAELKAKLGAMTAEKPLPKPKPKRVIHSAPKKGNIEQEALDKAMQGLRKRRAEKKAAQKAKKDE